MFDSSLKLIGTILIVTAISLGFVPILVPKLFRKQDILLIGAFFISGIILFSKDKLYGKELTEFSLILLTVPALFYTIESIRLRRRNTQ